MFCNWLGISSFGYGGFNFIMMLGILFVLIAIAYFAFNKSAQNRNFVPVREESPSEVIRILNARLANGDITEEEYRSIKNQILNG